MTPVAPTDDPVAAWRAVLVSQSRALRAIERDLHTAGLIPLHWYDVLLELKAAGGQLRMQELGMRTVLSRTRVSRLVTELEAAGLVERRPDPDDGRAALATITAAGRAAQRKAAPKYLAGVHEHFTRYLAPAEQDVIASSLQRVIDAHEADMDPRR